MSGRGGGDPGGSGLDRALVQPTPPTHPSYILPAAYSQLADCHSNVAIQNHLHSGQVPKDPKAVLERAFARSNLNPGAVPHQSAAGYSSLHVPKRSRSPPKKGAPPFQYRASPRPDGYHLLSSGPVTPQTPPITASFFHEAEPSSITAQQFNPNKPLPPLPSQGPPVEPFTRSTVPPPRPPRSPTVYDFSQYTFPGVPSTSVSSVKPFCQAPVAEPSEKSPPLGATQALTGRPLLFDPAKDRSRSPQLVPPHKPERHNPRRNPSIQKTRSPSPKPIGKLNFWKRAKRKISRRSPSPDSTRPATPVGRSSSGTTDTTPFQRPRAPTPNRGLGISTLQADLPGQKFSESLCCENALSLNKVTDIKTLFSVTDEGATILYGDPADDWEIEALAERGIFTTRIFDCPDIRFEDFGVCRAPSSLQDSATISAPKSENPRASQDSSETLVPRPERPFSYQDSPEILTLNSRNQRASRDSTATLVTPAIDLVIYRDPQDRYYSLTIGHTDRPPVAVAGGPEETSEWVEIPLSKFEKSESSPVPSCFFEENIEPECSQGQDLPRLPGEVNLKLSYPESIAVVETQPARVLRTSSERARVKEYCCGLPELPQLAPSTPKGEVYKGAYLALTGGLPTDSLCLEWGVDRYSSVRAEAGLHHSQSEEQLDDLQEKSPSCGRGRGRLRKSLAFSSEGFPSQEFRSYTSKRKYVTERRKRLAGYRPRSREGDRPRGRKGAGECISDKFLAKKREVDSPRSFSSKAAPVEEVGERITRKRALSAAKRVLERQRRLAAALDQGAASANQSSRDRALENTKPLEQQLSQDAHSVDCQSDFGEKVDEDLVVSSKSAPSVPQESVESLANPFQRFSSKVRSRSPSLLYHNNLYNFLTMQQLAEEDIVVCTRSKTGTVKELPITPENKKKIKAVLQLETGYTASVYSGDNKESAPPSVPDLIPSPLVIQKTPSPAGSEKTSHETPSGNVDPFRTARAFLDSCLSVSEENPLPTMDTLQVSSAIRSSTKTKAEEDARAMQKSVIESCKKAGRDPPKYVLMELIGKGSFGRVYKG